MQCFPNKSSVSNEKNKTKKKTKKFMYEADSDIKTKLYDKLLKNSAILGIFSASMVNKMEANSNRMPRGVKVPSLLIWRT